MAIDLTYNGNKVTGTMKMGGPEKPIDVDAGGPVFMDSGATTVVATLPLKTGYSAQFRNFDLRKQQPKLQDLKVTGEETVTVPAGTFEMGSPDGEGYDSEKPRHQVTIRKALYLGNHSTHILGLPAAESAALLRDLLEHATQPRFVYRHRWRAGDLVMWDNRCLLHRAVLDADSGKYRRIMHRSLVKGTVPY